MKTEQEIKDKILELIFKRQHYLKDLEPNTKKPKEVFILDFAINELEWVIE